MLSTMIQYTLSSTVFMYVGMITIMEMRMMILMLSTCEYSVNMSSSLRVRITIMIMITIMEMLMMMLMLSICEYSVNMSSSLRVRIKIMIMITIMEMLMMMLMISICEYSVNMSSCPFQLRPVGSMVK